MTGETQKGLLMENLAAAYFQAQGYLVRTDVPVRFGGRDATDIDVLGMRFLAPFRPYRIICDCKNRKSPNPTGRVFWVRGLASFTRSDAAFVALPNARSELVGAARVGGVSVITREDLSVGTRSAFREEKGYGIANPIISTAIAKAVASGTASSVALRDSRAILRNLLLRDNPYVALNTSLQQLSFIEGRFRQTLPNDPEYDALRFLASEAIVSAAIQLIYICSDTVGLSRADRNMHITVKLTHGDISPKKAQEMMRLCRQLAIEMAKSLRPGETVSPDALPENIMQPPMYASDVVGLVDRAFSAPYLYQELPRIVDYLLFELAPSGHGLSEALERPRYPGILTADHIKVARNVFSFVKSATGLDSSILWAGGTSASRAMPLIPDDG